MYVHIRERDSRPGFDSVKIKLLLFIILKDNSSNYILRVDCTQYTAILYSW